jgi:lipopolysaccharide export system protein LptA
MARLYFFLLIVFLFPARFATALDSDSNQPAEFKAQDIEIDLNTGQRTYRGDVAIQQGTLRMKADVIHLFFDDDVLQRAIAHGQPAMFQQQPEGSDHLLRGEAQTIEIDEIENVATFTGEAKLQQHRDQVTGGTIIFHMGTEQIQCLADCQMTVHNEITSSGQAEQLSALGATENVQISRSDLGIQPETEATAGKSANLSPEPSVLSTAVDTLSESTAQPTNSWDDTDKEVDPSNDSLQFHAARVISSGTVAYSEPGADAPVLGELLGRMPVKVLETRSSWARVAIPSGINVWVFASYIAQDRNGRSRIQGHSVRARWLPSTDSRIVGVLASDEGVRVLTTQNQWKQISLPPSIAAWVPVSQLEIMGSIGPTWRSDWQTQTGSPPAPGY